MTEPLPTRPDIVHRAEAGDIIRETLVDAQEHFFVERTGETNDSSFPGERRTKDKSLSTVEADRESDFDRNTGSYEYDENGVFRSVRQTTAELCRGTRMT